MTRVFLLWIVLLAGLRADPPDIVVPSPDAAWVIRAKWIDNNNGGYIWQLENVKSGKVYFRQEKFEANDAFPHRFDAIWSPDGRYAALDLYYGRAMAGVVVVAVGPNPTTFDPLPGDSKTPLEKTLVKPEDLAAFDGYNRLLVSPDSWANATDLKLNVSMLAYLDKNATSLATEWHFTVRLGGKTPKIIDRGCDSYDKEAVSR